MKIYFKFLFIVFLLFIGQGIGFAQNPEKGDKEYAKDRKALFGSYEGWQKVVLNSVEFYIPKDLKRNATKCFEGSCYRFESEDLLLKIDLSPEAWRPTFERYSKSYSEDFSKIDGKRAWLWSYEDEGIYKYQSGANFEVKQNVGWGPGMYLFSRTTNVNEIAKKIFNSVKFHNKLE